MGARHFAGTVGWALLISVGTIPLAAQSVPSNPNPSAAQRKQLERATQLAAQLVVRPKVRCGMTVIPADPKVDPKAIKPVPDQTTQHTIRKVPPAACR